MTRRIDEFRKFLITYPRWGEYGFEPPMGKFMDFSQISVDWFDSSAEISQLALQLTGSSIIRTGSDPTWKLDISGNAAITRQANFILHLLKRSGTNSERADTTEFLLDFIEWLDSMNVQGKVPIFGDEPLDERTWATNGGFVTEWADAKASVYAVQLHKIYLKKYEEEDF